MPADHILLKNLNQKIVWITESPIKSLALIQSSIYSISSLSAGWVPENWFEKNLSNCNEIIIAFDNDKAGRDGSDKLLNFLEGFKKEKEYSNLKISCAFPPKRKDWDELLSAGNWVIPEEELATGRWRGQLHLAENIKDYLEIWNEKKANYKNCYQGILEFKNWTLLLSCQRNEGQYGCANC